MCNFKCKIRTSGFEPESCSPCFMVCTAALPIELCPDCSSFFNCLSAYSGVKVLFVNSSVHRWTTEVFRRHYHSLWGILLALRSSGSDPDISEKGDLNPRQHASSCVRCSTNWATFRLHFLKTPRPLLRAAYVTPKCCQPPDVPPYPTPYRWYSFAQAPPLASFFHRFYGKRRHIEEIWMIPAP